MPRGPQRPASPPGEGWTLHAALRRPLAAAMGLALAVSGGIVALGPAAQAATGDGAVTVRVVREVNANGTWDGAALEPGMSGVTVSLTDDAGTAITGTTAADGTVTLRPAGT